MWNEVSSQPAVWQDLFNYYEMLTIGGGMFQLFSPDINN